MNDIKITKLEYEKIKNKNKVVYFYQDKENKIDIKSREVYKNKEIHFPFNPKNGKQKYKTIKSICYENRSNTKPLPAGFLKSFTNGYGFTRELTPILYKLQDEYPNIIRLTISNKRPSQIQKKNLVLNYQYLEKARQKISLLLTKQRDEINIVVNNILSEIFPVSFTKETQKYPKGEISRIFSKFNITFDDLDENEIQQILKLSSGFSKSKDSKNKTKIITTKKEVDIIYLEKILEEFNKIYDQKTKTGSLENKWQKFFRENILYFNFGYIEKFEKERVFGDKKVNYPDFILLDTYKFLDVYEIKTHLTQMLSFDSGRNNFYWHSEIAKAISQAENYIDSIIKQEADIIKNIRDQYQIDVDAIRPNVYIIAGSRDILCGKNTEKFTGSKKTKMKNDFRRLSNSLKNIKIVTYDDLKSSFNNMIQKLQKK